MKNLKVIVSICLLCICFFPSYGQETISDPGLEPLDPNNWGKYEKFAVREQGMQNFVALLSTAHKLKTFYNVKSKQGLTKEAFKQEFLKIDKNSSLEKRNLVNEMFLIVNKLDKVDQKPAKVITKEDAFDIVATISFNPDFDGMTAIAHKGVSNKVPPGQVSRTTAEEADRELRRRVRGLQLCVSNYQFCLGLMITTFSIGLAVTTFNIQGFIGLAGSGNTVAFTQLGIKTPFALWAMAVTIYYGRNYCRETLRQCQGDVFIPQ